MLLINKSAGEIPATSRLKGCANSFLFASSLQLVDKITPPQTTAGLTFPPHWQYVWVWIKQGFYVGCSSESDICSSFILYFPRLDVPLLIRLVREMLAYSPGILTWSINEPKSSINLGYNRGSTGKKQTWIQSSWG